MTTPAPPDKGFNELGDLQKQVVESLWTRGEATVHDVLADVAAASDRTPAYTTILSVLQKLEKAEWATHRRDGRTHVYRATISRDEENARSVDQVVDEAFGGDRMLLFRQLIDDSGVSPAELDELRALIEDRKRRLTDGA